MRRLAPHEHSLRVKTIIAPSQEASKRHLAAIDQRLQHLQNAPQAQVIEELNPLIVGWTAHYNGVVPAATMSQYDDLLEQQSPGSQQHYIYITRHMYARCMHTRTASAAWHASEYYITLTAS